MRLDHYLVQNGLAETRNKAQNCIKEGLVSVNGVVVLKSSLKLSDDDVRVKEHKEYVSRAAHKLAAFLGEIELDIKDKRCLDIGSSTGGFTQVLLEEGASHVSAVDVGRDQLHAKIKNDSRVASFEECDIRDFQDDTPYEVVVSDVAFISLTYILDDVNRLACGGIVLLFKPQFEVGREVKRDKNGVVTDEKAIQKAMIRFEDACQLQGWRLIHKSASKLTGKEGNLEYCYYYEK